MSDEGAREDGGYVTAELALALPALLLVLGFAVVTVGAVSLQSRCGDVARAQARALGRGDSEPSVLAAGMAALPRGSTTSVDRRAGLVRVTTSAPMLLPAPLRVLRTPLVTATAVAADEARDGTSDLPR